MRERTYQRRSKSAESGSFGLEQGSDEERMHRRRQLGRARFARIVEGGEPQSRRFIPRAECGIRAVVAAVRFLRAVVAIAFAQSTVGCEPKRSDLFDE